MAKTERYCMDISTYNVSEATRIKLSKYQYKELLDFYRKEVAERIAEHQRVFGEEEDFNYAMHLELKEETEEGENYIEYITTITDEDTIIWLRKTKCKEGWQFTNKRRRQNGRH